MKKSRFTDEQIIGFLKQVEGGVPVKDLCRKHGFSDATFYKWRSRLGGLDVSEARRLRELERRAPSSRSRWRRRCSISSRSRWWLGENGEPAGAA
jgi:putative transposase